MDQEAEQQSAPSEQGGLGRGGNEMAQSRGGSRATVILGRLALAARKVLNADPKAAKEFGGMIESADDLLDGVARVATFVFSKLLSSGAKGMPQKALSVVAGVASAVAAIEFAADRQLIELDEKTLPAVIKQMSSQRQQQQTRQQVTPQQEQQAQPGGLISGRMDQPQQGV